MTAAVAGTPDGDSGHEQWEAGAESQRVSTSEPSDPGCPVCPQLKHTERLGLDKSAGL